MRIRNRILISLALFSLFGALVFWSDHGLQQMLSLQSQIAITDERIRRIEIENRDLRRQIDVIARDGELALEDYARRHMGYARPGERVYLQSFPAR